MLAPGTKIVGVLSYASLTVNTLNSTGGDEDTDVAARGGMPHASALSSTGGACPALATGGAGRVRALAVTVL